MSGDVSKIINRVIRLGHMTSVDAYRAFCDDKDVRRYILTYHFDEELQEYLAYLAEEVALIAKPDKPAC